MPAYIDWRIEGGPRGLQGVVTCNHPATLYVREGARPHIIRPRGARALRFEVDGRVVFANVVHHPGARPNDFLGRALRLGRRVHVPSCGGDGAAASDGRLPGSDSGGSVGGDVS